ncbi:hypothetical protein DVH24_004505 [Malus domestica]|uniref:Leucine-rich repeat-containing N-terminal plant-type domain-containing protein n=1 Tax=Malus domestica TaxID=3750 RepID=A0A498IGF7_MALDO|nr:hypothetical protein DVH24_004505 [Malus domestica]
MHGELPPNVGVTLPNLQAFYCGANNFTGPIPPSFSNASRLQILNFAFNDTTDDAACSMEESWRNVLVSVMQIGLSCTEICLGEQMHTDASTSGFVGGAGVITPMPTPTLNRTCPEARLDGFGGRTGVITPLPSGSGRKLAKASPGG